MVTLGKYALTDHVTGVGTSIDVAWKQMDRVVLSWLYGSISPKLLEIVMENNTMAHMVWTTLDGLFGNNKERRAI